MKIKNLFLFLIISSMTIFAQEDMQTFLSLKNTGVAEFLKENPEYDGRGTIVFIFDTGVDQGVSGLTKTSTGEVKVIDVQDFTGQGDVQFFEAEIEEVEIDGKDEPCFINEDKEYQVAGVNKLNYKAVDDNYFIGMLPEKLWMNSGSRATDINGNGTEDDKFHFVTFKTAEDGEEFWVVYFDKEANGDVGDNIALRNYKENQQTFFIPNSKGLPNLAMGLNIFPERNVVNFHFDDGAHGTHCAGIAAGYKINDGELNGVAPGAYVISCKLGNNNFSGGSTVTESMKKCFDYVDKISKERKEPCIVNMSFGIGSELEGLSDMEKYINKLAKENPYIYLCTSNGNEGPGISTAGLPSASPYIFSSGAVLAQEVASDNYGCTLDKDIILYFSSRGGEVSKPDVISPGACTSTVPNWTHYDVFWGTSMASPYTTGVVSLLLSAAQAEFPDVKIPSLFLYKVIRESADFWPEYSHLDQGAGYVNVKKAWELLKKYIKAGEIEKFENYTISSTAPNMPNYRAQNLYIRNGSFIKSTDTYGFVIRRNDFHKKDKFYRRYKIECDADWVSPIQNYVYIKNHQAARVEVKFDKEKMSEPGLYNAKIKAYRTGSDKILEFEMMVTVVIPDDFNAENNYSKSWTESIAPGMFKRHFIKLPAGATSMKVNFESLNNKYTNSRFMLHDPDGIQIGGTGVLEEGETDAKYYYNLKPGVYELVTTGFYRAKDTSNIRLTVEFDGLKRLDDEMLSADHNYVKVVNVFNEELDFNLEGKIQGYKKEYEVKLDGKDLHKIPFTLKDGESAKLFEISISKEDYNKTTDFPIEIYNSKGKAVSKTGMSSKTATISVRNNDKENSEYELVLRPAFTLKPGKMTINIIEKTGFDNQPEVKVKGVGRRSTTFYPSIPVELKCDFSKPEIDYPEDANPYGKIYFKNDKDETVNLIPVEFKF